MTFLWKKIREYLQCGPRAHPCIKRYLKFNRQRWLSNNRRKDKGIVLVSLFRWNPLVEYNACFTNALAAREYARIAWFFFHPRYPLYEKIYASFGAEKGISVDNLQAFDTQAKQLAKEIFSGLTCKSDVESIAISKVVIGDLIYDAYLRDCHQATIDIRSPVLERIICDAIRIFLTCQDYFSKNKVVGVFSDHIVYIYYGILVRLALLSGVPVYQIFYTENVYLSQVSLDAETQTPMRQPFADYRRIFSQLPAEVQRKAVIRGLAGLEARLSGVMDGTLPHMSAYGPESNHRIFPESERPRIVIFLNDFCDAVHACGRMIFPDFYEWLIFVLTEAEKTSFDWYIKAHPHSLKESENSRVNKSVLEEIQTRFPKVKFIDPNISNKQMIAEGISAMFTVRGTAAHELAYLGVPVVNCGYNPHIAYDFNFHAKSVEELVEYIHRADSLQLNIRKEEIGEFFYMNYLHFVEANRSPVNIIPSAFFNSDEYQKRRSRPETFAYFTHTLSAEERVALDDYFGRL